ncbi:hypothetical protein JRO89_XS12G0069700 [Xanthoceras sorbifolium]|uniref:pyruvate decarboxylase n=1 Tax=Xanthoceras sorbifolium TaxID=99658 RepID=A0ABQ8HBL3_9ROSI|nr:hypothetical protein JRO89_XS12G0069700 [Xanthoceras sorbifolium]
MWNFVCHPTNPPFEQRTTKPPFKILHSTAFGEHALHGAPLASRALLYPDQLLSTTFRHTSYVKHPKHTICPIEFIHESYRKLTGDTIYLHIGMILSTLGLSPHGFALVLYPKVGGPNSNDYGSRKILHHTIDLPDCNQELACFRAVTCYQALINSLEDAHHQIDAAIAACLKESKPVYISISFLYTSDEVALEAALEATAEILNNAVKPVMVAGPKLFVSKACESFLQLGDACGYAVAVLPSAKGLIPENHPKFIGTYWGCISTAFCAEIVETADASLFVGPV